MTDIKRASKGNASPDCAIIIDLSQVIAKNSGGTIFRQLNRDRKEAAPQ
jgi:hypothetical protein